MKCPKCQESFTYGIGLYLKTIFGRFKCPACKTKLAVTDRSKELLIFFVIVGVYLVILFGPNFGYNSEAGYVWWIIILSALPIEFLHNRKQQPTAVDNVT